MTPEIKEYVDKAVSDKMILCVRKGAYWGAFVIAGAICAWAVFSFFFAHLVWRW